MVCRYSSSHETGVVASAGGDSDTTTEAQSEVCEQSAAGEAAGVGDDPELWPQLWLAEDEDQLLEVQRRAAQARAAASARVAARRTARAKAAEQARAEAAAALQAAVAAAETRRSELRHAKETADAVAGKSIPLSLSVFVADKNASSRQ